MKELRPNGPGRAATCDLYASGNFVVGRISPPLPPRPWVVRNPTVERPYVADDLPLVTNPAFRERAGRQYAHLARSKAYALSPSGAAGINYSASSPDEAMRRALELCGNSGNAACMVIAVDDTFVVAVPHLARVTGFYRPDAFTAVPPGARDEVARRLANANDGWNAVAVGAGGAFGIRVGAGSEQAAIAEALDDCSKRTRDCRIAVIGPFLVEPDPTADPAHGTTH
jgi:adenylate cyclase